MKPADTVSVVIVTSGDGMNELQIVQQYKDYMIAHMVSGLMGIESHL